MEGKKSRSQSGLPFSELKMYTEGLILPKPMDCGNGIKEVQYSCGQPGCKTTWLVKPEITTTSNYRRHYQRHHKSIALNAEPDLDEDLSARHVRKIVDFWTASMPLISYNTRPWCRV
jgi:hypothetical protein